MKLNLLKRKEVAEMFQVNAGTVRHWESKGIIKPFCKINGRPRYHMDELNKLFENKNTCNEK
jgi:DNA-binding transcriptional MerR regulator